MQPLLHLQVTYSTQSLSLSLPPSTPLSDFLETLSSHFSINPTTSKLLIKGKKLSLPPSPSDLTLEQVFNSNGLTSLSNKDPSKPLKLLLIASKSSSLDSLKANEELREKKRLAFQHHRSLAQFSKPSKSGRVHGLGGEDDAESYRFLRLEPFPKNVPCYEKREAMLKRLSEDEAVRHVMKNHKFVVGTLCVLSLFLYHERAN